MSDGLYSGYASDGSDGLYSGYGAVTPEDANHKQWETYTPQNGPMIHRLRVPGGWLYQVTAVAAKPKNSPATSEIGTVSVVFVPDR